MLFRSRITKRGAKGVKTINVTEKTGKLVAIKEVTDTDDLMIINKSGIAIRMAVEDLRVMGRATQGVRLIKVREEDSIAAVAKVMHDEDNIDSEDAVAEADVTAESVTDTSADAVEDQNMGDEATEQTEE